jgi:hypothetical protein
MHYMAKCGFEASHGKCNVEVLAEFERNLPGNRLPDDYREFIQEWNGGGFGDIVFFPLQDGEDDFGSTNKLYGLFDSTDQFDLRNCSTSYGFRTAVPLKYIAIGGLSWDLLCISVDLWQPGEPWPEHPPTTRFLRPVAARFRDFWDALTMDEE